MRVAQTLVVHLMPGVNNTLRRRSAIVVESLQMARLAALGRPRSRPTTRLHNGDLTAARLRALDPVCVLLALFDSQSDALDVLEWLARQAYRGRVLVLSPPLPKRGIVERELAEAGPGLRLTLLEIHALAESPRRSH